MVNRQGYCIRYYLSTSGGQSRTPVVYLEGDRLGTYDPKTRSFPKVDDNQDIDTDNLQKTANKLSNLSGATTIYLGRPGIEGSSGFHGYRRTWMELYIVQAALDAIKVRHNYQGFHLIGQSGGAGLIGGLLMLRADIGCAVPGAGRLAQLTNGTQKSGDRMLHYFDPIAEIGLIAARRSTRIIVVTDPADKRVEVQHQTAFVRALQQAGGRVEQYFVEATDDLRHSVTGYALRAVAGCIKNETAPQIELGFSVIRQLKLTAMARKRSQGAAQPSAPAPAQPRRS